MGFFSKKTFICEKCGKEFQARITFGIHICDECWDRQNNKIDNVKGYVDYANKACWDEYTEEQLDAIAAHRDVILEKYRVQQGISRAELAEASANYKRLSHEEAGSVVVRSMLSSVDSTLGAAYTDGFFVPTAFEKTIVDAQDVFAVAYRTDHKLKSSLYEEAILCAVFTNDPYIPAFPMVFIGNLGFFELKSKGGRLGVTQFFEEHCPNLTYPVQELKQLNKQVKAEGSVRGKIDPIFMRAKIENALVSGNIFDTKKKKMKKTFKKILMTSATIVLTILPGVNASTAFAKGWQQDDKGWRYIIDDNWGWYCNSWQWLDGNNDGIAECYYFGADGYMVSNDKTPDGYTVNANGAWVNNGTVQTKTAEKVNTMPDYNLLFGSYSDGESNYINNTAVDNETDFSNYARECFDLINEERTSRGLDALEWNDTIAEACDVRAQELSEKYSHVRPDGTMGPTVFDEVGFYLSVRGENIAYGQKTPEEVIYAWMHSEGHKKNILKEEYTGSAIGFYYDTAKKQFYWVQLFTGSKSSSSSSSSSSKSSKSSTPSSGRGYSEMTDDEKNLAMEQLGLTEEELIKNNVRVYYD